MPRILKTTCVAAMTTILATAPLAAFAQAGGAGDTAPPPLTAPQEGAPAGGADQGGVLSQDSPYPANDPADPGAAAPDQTEEAALPVEGQITEQTADTYLASELMGATVHTADGEAAGAISDVLVNLDGNVEGLVIGVGGFLGMGAKNVALEMARLNVVEDQDGTVRLETTATSADLESAPAFVSKAEQRANAASDALDRSMDAAPDPTTVPTQ